MPGRSPAVAVANFVEPLQRAVSCVTRVPLVVSPGGYRVLERVHSLTWGTPEPVELRTRTGTKLLLDLAILYEIVHLPGDREFGPYQVKTRGYLHTVQTTDPSEQDKS